MGSEKVLAFYQSWWAMCVAGWAAQVQIVTAASSASSGALVAASGSALDVWSAGLAPVHRAAVANARRLSRRRR